MYHILWFINSPIVVQRYDSSDDICFYDHNLYFHVRFTTVFCCPSSNTVFLNQSMAQLMSSAHFVASKRYGCVSHHLWARFHVRRPLSRRFISISMRNETKIALSTVTAVKSEDGWARRRRLTVTTDDGLWLLSVITNRDNYQLCINLRKEKFGSWNAVVCEIFTLKMWGPLGN